MWPRAISTQDQSAVPSGINRYWGNVLKLVFHGGRRVENLQVRKTLNQKRVRVLYDILMGRNGFNSLNFIFLVYACKIRGIDTEV